MAGAISWLPQGRKLLTVKTDCTLPFEPIDLIVRAADAAALKNLYERFEFKSWLKDLDGAPAKTTGVGSGAEAAAVPQEPPRAAVAREYETIFDQAALDRWLAAIEQADLVTFDIETTSLDPMQARIVGISFAIVPGRAAYVPVAHRYAGAPLQLPLDAVLARLKPWLENPRAKKLGQNVKYDQHVLANHGIVLAGVAHDTMLQSYVLESHRLHDMDNLAWRHLDVKTLSYAEVAGKGVSQIAFDQVAVDRATEYSAEDADITLQPTPSSRMSMNVSSCRRAKCSSAWSATACCSIRYSSPRRAACSASGCSRWSSKRFSSPAARSIWDLHASLARSCSTG
jgi:DNA polymerase-1